MTEPSIFDYLKDVLFTKKRLYVNNHEESLNFQPFMLQRWCSMASAENTLILNESINRWSILYNNKNLIYKLMFSVLPKQRQKKVAYIKKPTKSSNIEDLINKSYVAEISQRELKEYNDLLTKLSYD
jgi:hypothetical protein